ncbi:WD40-repeat-containing domain protein [Bisporella sp. PMI_857]|nr:WD40-repeat-containing domain protein [Bisporella sp. PMI_857]
MHRRVVSFESKVHAERKRTRRPGLEVANVSKRKTITTTTTTKRSYPSLLVRNPLASLDVKEYPLAHKEIPAELANFSFESMSSRVLPEKLPKSPASLPSKPHKVQLDSETAAENFRSLKEKRSRRHGLGIKLSDTCLATPDLSELETAANDQNQTLGSFQATYTPQSGMSQNGSLGDGQQDETTDDLVDSAHSRTPGQRPSLSIAVAQNASLPSPGLSPTFYSEDSDDASYDNAVIEDHLHDASSATHLSDSQQTAGSDGRLRTSRSLHGLHRISRDVSPPARTNAASLRDTSSMLEAFEAMPNEMKTFMMYHFLKRCSRKTLHIVADVVNPALKCDFIGQLPLELSLHILSYLDHRDLCRAARASKQWRNIIDSNESGWKELFDRDGLTLPLGELERSIKQGWGWQDPYGPDGYEEDLSVPESEPTRKALRSSIKRKRLSHLPGSADRAKRRALGHDNADKAYESNSIRYDKSEGPLAAANAAALAVPNPQVGLPSLRQLHLFKSLYRRHHLLQRSWTSGKVEPRHFAFPAHPSHVITCLQFDDDKILTGSDDTLIHVYDARTGKLRKKLEGHEGGVWALQYEGNVLVSGSTDRSVRVWDIEKGLCTQVFNGHTSTVRCLQILMPEATGRVEKGQPVMLPEKPLIITGSRDSQLRVWKLPEQGAKRYIQSGPLANDADCPYFVRSLHGHTHSVRAIAAHQDTLISTGETVHRLQGHSMKVYSVVLDNKRNRCISGSMDNSVKIWSLGTGQCLFTLDGHTSLVGLLDLRDERLVSAAADSTLRIWDPENGQCKNTLSAHTGAITCFQHDGQKVISGSDRTLKISLTDLSGVWQVKFDERRCVAAVQRDNRTYVEVTSKRGFRDLVLPDGQSLPEDERLVEEEGDEP